MLTTGRKVASRARTQEHNQAHALHDTPASQCVRFPQWSFACLPALQPELVQHGVCGAARRSDVS